MRTLHLTEAEFAWIVARLNAETSMGVFEEIHVRPRDPALEAKFCILKGLSRKLRDCEVQLED